MGRLDFLGAAMSISCVDSHGPDGPFKVDQRVAHGSPAEQCPALVDRVVRTRVAERLRINDSHAPQKVLRMVRIDHVLANTEPRAVPVLVFPHKVFEQVAKPGLVAVSVGVLSGGVSHQYRLPGVRCSEARSRSSAAARSNCCSYSCLRATARSAASGFFMAIWNARPATRAG